MAYVKNFHRLQCKMVYDFAILLLLWVCGVLALAGCSQSITTEDKEGIMNDLEMSVSGWKDISIEILYADRNETNTVNAKSYRFQRVDGTSYPIKVIAIVLLKPKVNWVGGEQDFYLQSGSTLLTGKVGPIGGSVAWGRNLLPESESQDIAQLTDEFVGTLDLAEFRNTIANRNLNTTDLRDCFSDRWFFDAEKWSSQPGIIELLSVEIDNGNTIKLVIKNETSKRTGTVWINLESKEVIKAMENGVQTFPKNEE